MTETYKLFFIVGICDLAFHLVHSKHFLFKGEVGRLLIVFRHPILHSLHHFNWFSEIILGVNHLFNLYLIIVSLTNWKLVLFNILLIRWYYHNLASFLRGLAAVLTSPSATFRRFRSLYWRWLFPFNGSTLSSFWRGLLLGFERRALKTIIIFDIRVFLFYLYSTLIRSTIIWLKWNCFRTNFIGLICPRIRLLLNRWQFLFFNISIVTFILFHSTFLMNTISHCYLNFLQFLLVIVIVQTLLLL